MKWFSATLAFKTVQNKKVISEDNQVFLIQSVDWEDAFNCACECGRNEEFTYTAGYENRETHYTFTSVITLDRLPDKLISGTKIVNHPVRVEPYEYSKADPSSSEPTQTIF